MPTSIDTEYCGMIIILLDCIERKTQDHIRQVSRSNLDNIVLLRVAMYNVNISRISLLSYKRRKEASERRHKE